MDTRVTVWHITFGTYGSRLHGCDRPTVDREHNQPGEAFCCNEPQLERYERDLMTANTVVLSSEQRRLIESIIPSICERGRWTFVTCAAASNHVHVLLGVPKATHGNDARKWLKRWLSQALTECWNETQQWWAKGGSARVVPEDQYFHACVAYINAQRFAPGCE